MKEHKQVDINYLADYPQYIATVNDWLYDQWGQFYPERTREDWYQRLKKRMNYQEIPTVYVAIAEEKPIGTASLFNYDMENHKHLSPWLAAVYVREDKRRQGIGSMLVKRAMKEAKELNVKTLYLFTPDMKDFYAQLGWEVFKITYYEKYQQEVVIMLVDL